MIVTKVERQKRHPERVNLYLDGEFALGLSRDVVVKFGLRKGDQITDEQIQELASSEEFTAARQKAMRLIDHRWRSEKEIRLKLTEKEFEPQTIDNVIEYLRSTGLADDLRFARAMVNDLQLRRPSGRKLLSQKLRMKGISAAIVQQVLDENVTEKEEEKTAYEAAKKLSKRYLNSRKIADKVKQQKWISDSLARRGFDWQIITLVLKRLFNQNTVTTPEE